MPRNAAYDDLIWAMSTGAAVTPDQVEIARQGAADLSALADDVRTGASAYLPDAPTGWRSSAAAAYADALDEARSALVSAATILADAAQGVSSHSWRLEGRLVEQNTILAAGPEA